MKSGRTGFSSRSKMTSPWSSNRNMKELHKEFSKLNTGESNPQKFKRKAEELGLKPTEDIQKVLNDPNPKFKNVVRSLQKFQKPKTQERLPTKYGGNHPRYRRAKDPGYAVSKNKKLAALQDFQRGKLSVEQLNKKLGKKNVLTGRDLENINSGDFTRIASKVVRDDRDRAEKCTGLQNIDPVVMKGREVDLRHTFGKYIEAN